jgi:hypothetical protein
MWWSILARPNISRLIISCVDLAHSRVGGCAEQRGSTWSAGQHRRACGQLGDRHGRGDRVLFGDAGGIEFRYRFLRVVALADRRGPPHTISLRPLADRAAAGRTH